MAFEVFSYNRSNRVLLNLIFWVFYFIYPFLRFRYTGEHTVTVEEIAFYLTFYGGILYINNLYLLPKFLSNKRFKEYFLIIVPVVLAAAFFESYVNKTLLKTCECEGPNSTYVIYNFIHLGSLLVMFSSVLVFRNYNAKIQALEHAQNERLEAELRFLKAQVNPHLLFNSLNSIYAYAIKNSDQAPEMVLKLSDILRYMLYECDKPMVSLNREIDYLNDYIALQRMRQADFQVSLDVSGVDERHEVAPMIFIAFIENAFKYASPSQPEIKIKIAVDKDELSFVCENKFERPNEKSYTLEAEGGLGLANAKKLLNVSYPDSHSLRIDEKNDVYQVNLSLRL